ncbi:hypothetical protein K469DRAFT_725974 [Zopfia rhizophila CBS 207.26]|uniref:ATP-dependent DNA helicase n=1 Tax=Zopfia rhizophila CBS 207.26 TaxID=1314779 RepID=A0A6A6ET98_9PEZI|nr:hypothetical protein K469DRAFT_725974 [Zopfia rhizophila CBS 207.26]
MQNSRPLTGEGGTGKSQVIKALITLFVRKKILYYLIVTATSRTAAARINSIIIHSMYNFLVDISYRASDINSAGMLRARTLHAVNKQLCVLQGCIKDFTHTLWRKFTTVVILNEQESDITNLNIKAILSNNSSILVPAIFMFITDLKLVNGAYYKALNIVLNQAYLGHRISANTVLHFGPPAGIILTAESIKDFNFISMPPGTILLTPLSLKIECVRRQLPCTAAFACTDYKVQGRTLEKLSRCRSLDSIILLLKVRERYVIGNTIPENIITAEKRLEELSKAMIQETES